ncbi:MAG: DoxX family protein [Ktedonobacteraceae bacterium]
MLRLLGQQLLSAIFMKGGADAFMQPGGRTRVVAASGLSNPETAVELNGVAMVVGGAMLALDIAPKLAAALLIGSMAPTTVVGHAFWKEQNETVRRAQLTQFLKNLGLMGGLLVLLVEKEDKRERRHSRQGRHGDYGPSRRRRVQHRWDSSMLGARRLVSLLCH